MAINARAENGIIEDSGSGARLGIIYKLALIFMALPRARAAASCSIARCIAFMTNGLLCMAVNSRNLLLSHQLLRQLPHLLICGA